jgi:hypothetical protein
MSEKMEENEKKFWQREENKKKIKKLAALMNQAVDNPQVTDEELEMIAGLRAGPHQLDTAANGCPG